METNKTAEKMLRAFGKTTFTAEEAKAMIAHLETCIASSIRGSVKAVYRRRIALLLVELPCGHHGAPGSNEWCIDCERLRGPQEAAEDAQ